MHIHACMCVCDVYIYHHHHHHVLQLARISLTLATFPNRSSSLVGLQGHIQYPHIAAECMFELVILLFPAICGGP